MDTGRATPPPAPPDPQDEPLPASFVACCDEAGVLPADRERLYSLHRRWRRKGASDGVLLAERLTDYGHWRLYIASRSGDPESGRRFHAYWQRYARAFLAGRFPAAEVKDLSARFFARVYRLVTGEFHWDCPFVVYLRAVLVNVFRDELGRTRERRHREVALDDEDAFDASSLAARGPSPEEDAIERERTRLVREAVRKLAPLDRHIVRACLLEGENARELADRLGMQANALYQRLHRARKQLRKLLEESALLSGFTAASGLADKRTGTRAATRRPGQRGEK